MAATNETELVDAARKGDKQAFTKLVQKHSRKIYHTALHLITDADEAEDLTQETFVKAYRAIDRFDGRSSFLTWIYRILINLSLNRRKALARTRSGRLQDPRIQDYLIEKSRPNGENPEKNAANRKAVQALVAAIDGDLSEVLRTTLVLVVFENVDYKQASEILGCSEGTVAWRVFRAREILREKLKDHLS